MRIPDIEAGMRSLRESLRQIKTLLAWEQLKQAEARPGQNPAYLMSDPTEQDLRYEYSFFLSTAVQMNSMLQDSTFKLSENKRKQIKRRLMKAEQELYSLGLHHRFIRY